MMAAAWPLIRTRFTRDFAPATIVTSRDATPVASAISRQSAAFASPSEGGSAHPRLDDSLAIVAALDAFDCIAAAARRETHIDNDAVRRRRPSCAVKGSTVKAAGLRSKNVRQDVERDDVANENDDQK